MKIYMDVSVLTLATFVTGIQRVTREIAVRLIEAERDNVVLLHYNAKENVYHRIDNKKFCEYYVHGNGVKNRMITGRKVAFEEMDANSVFFDLDAAWMCRVKRSWLLPILKKQGVRIIAHVYDIISITHPQYCLQRGVYNFMDFIGAHLQYADEIIVNAKATVEELQKLADRVKIELPPCHVVPLAADFGKKEAVADSQVKDELVTIVKERPYILMVGTIEPRKNHKLLLEAYDKGLKDKGYNIIMAGYMGWDMEEFDHRLKAHPDFGKRVFHLEGLDDTAISYLYQNAFMLAFCSYTEGFGLPIIEAIQRGVPVLAADVPVLREVGGEDCLWFEQDNAEDFCEKVYEYARTGKKEALALGEKKALPVITWTECGDRILALLKGVQEESE